MFIYLIVDSGEKQSPFFFSDFYYCYIILLGLVTSTFSIHWLSNLIKIDISVFHFAGPFLFLFSYIRKASQKAILITSSIIYQFSFLCVYVFQFFTSLFHCILM
jgi:hypothetical protein